MCMCTLVGTVEAVKSELSDLYLRNSIGDQSLTSGVLRDQDGIEYPLSQLKPYTALFSPKHFDISDNETVVTDKRTGETFLSTVSRGVFGNGAIVQVDVGGEDCEILSAEIRRPNGRQDLFFVKNEAPLNSSQSMLAFTPDDIDVKGLRANFLYGESEAVGSRPPSKSLRAVARQLLPDFVRRRGDGGSSECTYFKVVELAIVFDSEFCGEYGSFSAARNRIMAIVASASVYYERDMCVKLRLTNIASPDKSCGGLSTTFRNFPRQKTCGSGENFLSSFSTWMATNRDTMSIDPNAAVHLFSGYPTSGIIGCAWIGTLCWNKYDYGIEHMTFNSNIAIQGIVLAHELGHNLNAVHFNAPTLKHIMEAKLSSGADGFSQASADAIISFLDSPSITCDAVEIAPQPSSSPSITPTPSPSASPSSGEPSSVPTTSPSAIPSSSPSRLPTRRPSTDTPSGAPSAVPTATSMPSHVPSQMPTTSSPSRSPTPGPSPSPSSVPYSKPSSLPTVIPSDTPSGTPFAYASRLPTRKPSALPSVSNRNCPRWCHPRFPAVFLPELRRQSRLVPPQYSHIRRDDFSAAVGFLPGTEGPYCVH
jgi:hypothetical protein